MRIAFLIRSLGAGGAERAAAALANGLARKGHAVTLCVLTGNSSFYQTDPEVRVLYFNERANEFTSSDPRELMQRIRKIRRFLHEDKPQILVGMSYTMSAYAAFCCKGTPVYAIGTERANPFVYSASVPHTLLRRIAAVHCDGFICQTKKALSFFPRSVQLRAAVIPNGLYNPIIDTISVPNNRKKEITAMGRLDQNKGFDVLLHAFKLFHAQEPEYSLTIWGDGNLRKDLLALSEKLGISSHFSLPGNDPDALRHIAESSVFVLSSRSEGMPNALMEAMAVGVPCVATRCDMGPEELISDGRSGLLVPVDDPRALSDAMLKIVRYRTFSESLSENALKIRQTHSLDHIVDLWLAYFRSICA